MKKHEADALIETIRGFVEGEQRGPKAAASAKAAQPTEDYEAAKQSSVHSVPVDVKTPDEFEKLYCAIKRRFIEEAKVDPVLLHLIQAQPEIVVEIEPQVMTLDGGTVKGRAARLIAEGWFDECHTSTATRNELKRTGSDPGGGGIGNVLPALVREGFLTLESDGYRRAPGVKVTKNRIET